MKKAYLINPTDRTVAPVSYGDYTDIYTLVGCTSFEAAYPDNETEEIVFIDGEGLYNHDDFFLIEGNPQPLAGNGLYVGPADNNGDTLDVVTPIEEVTKGVQFMTKHEAYTYAMKHGL